MALMDKVPIRLSLSYPDGKIITKLYFRSEFISIMVQGQGCVDFFCHGENCEMLVVTYLVEKVASLIVESQSEQNL